MLEFAILEASQAFTVPAGLIYGIVMAESSGNPWAMRYESHYKWLHNPKDYTRYQSLDTEKTMQKTSFGLMQIMGANLRNMGFDKPFLTQALGVRTNLYYGTKFFRNLYDTHLKWKDAISAYNQGSPRKSNGEYTNQKYVDRVLEFSEEWEEPEYLSRPGLEWILYRLLNKARGGKNYDE